MSQCEYIQHSVTPHPPNTPASPSSKSLATSCRPNNRANSSSLAHTTQWISLSGVLRMVHMGNVLGAGLGAHSKHSVTPDTCTVACTRWPRVVVRCMVHVVGCMVCITYHAWGWLACPGEHYYNSNGYVIGDMVLLHAITEKHIIPVPGSQQCHSPPMVSQLPVPCD